MFEGKPPLAPQQSGLITGENVTGELRMPSWSELVAKLAAARELRAELAAGGDSGLASFDAESARHLAALGEHAPEHGKQDVNPDGLVNGKAHRCKEVSRADCDEPATRGS